MKLINDLLVVLTVVIPAAFILLAVFCGFKRNICQSLAKLGMTIFAISLSVLITKLVAPAIAQPTFTQLANLSNNVSSELASSIAQLLAVLFMPIIFTAAFSVVSLVCLILYLTISKKKLSDDKIVEMKNRKNDIRIPVIETVETATNCELQKDHTEATANDNAKVKKIWLRVGSVALSILSVILMLAHFAMPITYYSDVAEEMLSVPFAQETAGSELLPGVNLVSNYPTVVCYRVVSTPATWCFDRISTTSGEGDSAKNAISTLISVVNSLTNLDNAPNRGDFYAVAEKLKDSPYLDNLLLQTVTNLVDAWERGESFLGLQPDVLGNDFPLDTLKSCVESVDSSAELFYMLGDLLSLPEIIEGGVTSEALTKVFVEYQPKSIAALESVVLSGIKDLNKFSINVSENLVSSVFSAILDVRNNMSLSNEEKTKILTTEAESLTVFLSIMDNPKKADPNKVGKAIVQSKAISDAITATTESGVVKDPCGFGKVLSSSFIKKLKGSLEKEGIAKDSELYKSVNAFFSKK